MKIDISSPPLNNKNPAQVPPSEVVSHLRVQHLDPTDPKIRIHPHHQPRSVRCPLPFPPSPAPQNRERPQIPPSERHLQPLELPGGMRLQIRDANPGFLRRFSSQETQKKSEPGRGRSARTVTDRALVPWSGGSAAEPPARGGRGRFGAGARGTLPGTGISPSGRLTDTRAAGNCVSTSCLRGFMSLF